jgi:hypothetical protein
MGAASEGQGGQQQQRRASHAASMGRWWCPVRRSGKGLRFPSASRACRDECRTTEVASGMHWRSSGLTPLHAMQCRAATASQVRSKQAVQRSSPSYRDCPLDTAGDRCLWHAGGTVGENDDARTWRRRLPVQPEGGARPRVTPASWGKSPEARGSWVGDSNSGPPLEGMPGGGSAGGLTCGS